MRPLVELGKINNFNHWTSENDTKKIHFKIQGPSGYWGAQGAREHGWASEAIRATSEPDFCMEEGVWERDELFRKIGELEMHRDFLKKSLQKAGLWRNVKP